MKEIKMDENNLAMQVRCVHCKREQYSLAVWSISNGESDCPWCGKASRKMTYEEYKIALSERSKDA